MTEKLISGEKLKEKLQSGINKLADTVKETLGPQGNTVIIKNAFGEITITKDGVSVAEEIYLKDPIENLGSELVKKVAMKANNLAGDGTTTSTILAQALYNEGIKHIEKGVSTKDFKRGINLATKDVINELEGMKKTITPDDDLMRSIALISSNEDQEITEVITDIYKKLGEHAVISVTHGNGLEITYNVVKGMQFDRGYISPYAVTDKIKKKVDFENPFIFIYDGKLTDFEKLHGPLEYAGNAGRPLVVIAEDIKEAALRGLVVNYLSGNVKSVGILSPGYGRKRTARLEDMAVLFGGKVFDKDNSNPSQFDANNLGQADKIEVTDKDTAIIGGKGDKELIKKRIEFIQKQLEENNGNDYETKLFEERIGKLSSGVAVIKVGAMTVEEGKEILDRVEDCKFAVRAALQQGIVKGGGMAFKEIATKLENKSIPENLQSGYKALLKAILQPFNQICENANVSKEVITLELNKIKDQNKGYNAATNTIEKDMFKAGIVDPFKVSKIALESAVSIVGTLLTTNYAVVNKEDATVANFT